MPILIIGYLTFIIGYVLISLFIGLSLIKTISYALDKTVVFLGTTYLLYPWLSNRLTSQYAVYLWCIFIGLLFVGFYSILFKVLYLNFPRIGSILNLIIAYLGVMFMYCFLVNAFITNGKSYFLEIVNSPNINNILNYIIIGIIVIPIWLKREKQIKD